LLSPPAPADDGTRFHKTVFLEILFPQSLPTAGGQIRQADTFSALLLPVWEREAQGIRSNEPTRPNGLALNYTDDAAQRQNARADLMKSGESIRLVLY
jgi:hypothetical protein